VRVKRPEGDPGKVVAYAEAARELWRLFPHSFAQRLSGGKWRAWSYLRLVSLAIARMAYTGGGQLLVSLPVRHGKSELISHWVPVWFLSTFPNKNVILTSYEADFAASWGRKARNTLGEFAEVTGVRVADDSTAANRWHTSQGGGMTTAGVGGPITGRGGHLVIVDDPIKNAEEADSETVRAKQIDWFDSTLYTRREPGAVTVVLMARWHEADLYGYLATDPKHQGKWKEIRLPALAEDGDPLGRKLGEALCPERYNRIQLEETKAAVQARWFNALYQQTPTSAEGAEIKRHWWRWYDELPVVRERLDFVVASWDCSFRDTDGSDYVVGQVWGVYGSFRYLLGQTRDRLDFTSTVQAVAASHEKWRPNVTLIEAKANGDAVINTLSAHVPGIVPVEPQGGKESRVRGAAPQIEAGNVYLPKTKWAEELVEEAAAFPLGKHDDMVDACSQALNWLLYHKTEHLTHLQPGDNRFVPPHLLALQQRGVLGLAPALKGRI
jgi:predicted phage terminase large subunit-like protein